MALRLGLLLFPTHDEIVLNQKPTNDELTATVCAQLTTAIGGRSTRCGTCAVRTWCGDLAKSMGKASCFIVLFCVFLPFWRTPIWQGRHGCCPVLCCRPQCGRGYAITRSFGPAPRGKGTSFHREGRARIAHLVRLQCARNANFCMPATT